MNDHDVFILVRSYSLLLRGMARRVGVLRKNLDRANGLVRRQASENRVMQMYRNANEQHALEIRRLRVIIDALIRKAGGEVVIAAEEAATAISAFYEIPVGNDLRLMTRERYIDPNVLSSISLGKCLMTEPRPEKALSLEDIAHELRDVHGEALKILGESSDLVAELINPNEPPARILPHGQVWVWLNGAEIPHWEIRGTGAIIE